MLVEVEIDSLDQLDAVLAAGPDIVLLDNMTPDKLQAAVARRNELAPNIELEASGGVSLETVREIAHTGVERISVGGLTHSARSLDIGLDWLPPRQPLDRNPCCHNATTTLATCRIAGHARRQNPPILPRFSASNRQSSTQSSVAKSLV